MSDSVDRVFVHALNTVKRIPRHGSARPPPVDRLRLYGLYKQSMEGDVERVMDRPTGDTEEIWADQEKWDAWNKQKGISRTEAKRRYISTLIDTMRQYASSTPDAKELVSELEFVWDQIKSISPSSSSTNSYPLRDPPQASPNETTHTSEAIYPAISEGGGSRRPRSVTRTDSKGLRVLSPVSQSQLDQNERGDETQDEQGDEFVDAQDSQVADNDVADNEGSDGIREGQGPSGAKNKAGVEALVGPISNYVKRMVRPQDESATKWHRRIENAIMKMNAELAALREQVEMQQSSSLQSSILHPFGTRPFRRKGGVLRWIFESISSILSVVWRHLLIDAALIAGVTIWMYYRGIPPERLEHIILAWTRAIQQLGIMKRLQRYREEHGRIGIKGTLALFSLRSNNRGG